MLAIYFIVWWLVFFAVLPWGIRSQDEHGHVVHASDPGAPAADFPFCCSILTA